MDYQATAVTAPSSDGAHRPSELAWGLAIGVGIGLIPKGNLVSLMLIGLLVSMRVNHGIAALSAVACSFLAGRLDPWTHELGVLILGSDGVRGFLERIWTWPLMPWTDLNNTVVMGSTLLAAIAFLPTYAISLPLFRWLAPPPESRGDVTDPPPAEAAASEAAVAQVQPAEACVQTSEIAAVAPAPSETRDGDEEIAEARLVGLETEADTHIDIIRFKTAPADAPASADDSAPATGDTEAVSGGQMNEALGYLLRRLRDSRQGKAA